MKGVHALQQHTIPVGIIPAGMHHAARSDPALERPRAAEGRRASAWRGREGEDGGVGGVQEGSRNFPPSLVYSFGIAPPPRPLPTHIPARVFAAHPIMQIAHSLWSSLLPLALRMTSRASGVCDSRYSASPPSSPAAATHLRSAKQAGPQAPSHEPSHMIHPRRSKQSAILTHLFERSCRSSAGAREP